MSDNYGEIKVDDIGNQNEYIDYHKKLNHNTNITSYNIYNYNRSTQFIDEVQRYNYLSEYSSTVETPLDILIYDSNSNKIYLKSNNILSYDNKRKLKEKLKENNTYLIHVAFQTRGNEFKFYDIIFIDNCCNYYKIYTTNYNQDYYSIFESKDIPSKVKLNNIIIDSIKSINQFDIYNMLNIVKQQNKLVDSADSNADNLSETSEFESTEAATPCFVYHPNLNETCETSVMVAGSFNNWKQYIMTYDDQKKIFILNMKLKKGEYEYKFIVNGEWKLDETLPFTMNCNGYNNHKITVKNKIYFIL